MHRTELYVSTPLDMPSPFFLTSLREESPWPTVMRRQANIGKGFPTARPDWVRPKASKLQSQLPLLEFIGGQTIQWTGNKNGIPKDAAESSALENDQPMPRLWNSRLIANRMTPTSLSV